MKQSIRHLPKCTQEELNILLELIKHYIPTREIKEMAEEEYYPSGSVFLTVGKYTETINEYANGSFQLHQSCERFYHAISLVFTNDRPSGYSPFNLRSSHHGMEFLG